MTIGDAVSVMGAAGALLAAGAWLGPVVKGWIDVILGRSRAVAATNAELMSKRAEIAGQVQLAEIADEAQFRAALIDDYKRIQKDNAEILKQHAIILGQNAGQEERIKTLEAVNPALRRQRDEARRMASELQKAHESAKATIREVTELLEAARKEIMWLKSIIQAHGLDPSKPSVNE
jgi:DNA repair exonuclease SbcCD ATPase subunit